MERLILKLYVAGRSHLSEVAVANLQRICDHELQGHYQMEVIDVLERPQLAEEERILATPTVIKQLPPPLRRVVGDLSDIANVMTGLDLKAR